MFTIRVKKAEKARFEALATAAGLPLTAWARRALLEAADRSDTQSRVEKPPGDPKGKKSKP